MNRLLGAEHVASVLLGMVAFWTTGLSWWWFVGLLLAPDVSMLGYLFGTRVGATTYNLFHHVGLAVVIGLAGWTFELVALELAGIILFTHAHMDRVLGYGLKYPDDFRHTHIGWIRGKKKNRGSSRIFSERSARAVRAPFLKTGLARATHRAVRDALRASIDSLHTIRSGRNEQFVEFFLIFGLKEVER